MLGTLILIDNPDSSNVSCSSNSLSYVVKARPQHFFLGRPQTCLFGLLDTWF